MPRTFALALTAGALLWAAILFGAPLALTRGGTGTAAGGAVVYASASRICHQRPERSFDVFGAPMPVCGRCAGLYLSGALGVLLAWGPRWRGRRAAERLVLTACAVPTALTWGLEAAGLMTFSTAIRAAAAVPLGAAAGWLFVHALRDEARAGAPAPQAAAPRAL